MLRKKLLKGPGPWSLMRGGDEQGLGARCLLSELEPSSLPRVMMGELSVSPAPLILASVSHLVKQRRRLGCLVSPAQMWLERPEAPGARQRGPHARLPPPPAQVLIVRSTTITLTPSSETDVSLVYRGFIHPLLPGGPGGSGAEDVAVWARAQRLHVLARMARGPDTENMVRMPGTLSGLFMVNTGCRCVAGSRTGEKLEAWDISLVEGGPERGSSFEQNWRGILKKWKLSVTESDSPEEKVGRWEVWGCWEVLRV